MTVYAVDMKKDGENESQSNISAGSNDIPLCSVRRYGLPISKKVFYLLRFTCFFIFSSSISK